MVSVRQRGDHRVRVACSQRVSAISPSAAERLACFVSEDNNPIVRIVRTQGVEEGVLRCAEQSKSANFAPNSSKESLLVRDQSLRCPVPSSSGLDNSEARSTICESDFAPNGICTASTAAISGNSSKHLSIDSPCRRSRFDRKPNKWGTKRRQAGFISSCLRTPGEPQTE